MKKISLSNAEQVANELIDHLEDFIERSPDGPEAAVIIRDFFRNLDKSNKVNGAKKKTFALRKLNAYTWNYRGYNIVKGIQGGYGVRTENDGIWFCASTIKEIQRKIDKTERNAF